MLRVGVAGALGRLGRVACATLAAADDIDLVARFARHAEPGVVDSLDAFYAIPMDVVVDCTTYPASIDVARAAIDAGVAPVVGASGWTNEDLVVLRDRAEDTGVPAAYVPNFALGAVLMQRFAEEAARVFKAVEIIELHHDGKKDAPSGTALATAQRIRSAGGLQDVHIHSVRLPGLVAHQEVIFGGTGETLTIRHDSLARESFSAGIVFAVRGIRARRGLTVGLDAFLPATEVPV